MTDDDENFDKDPIVDEVRAIREKILAKYGYDLAAYCQDARRRDEEAARAGNRVISAPPPAHPPEIQPKKAG